MIYNFTQKVGITSLAIFCSLVAVGQQVNSSITNWKNNTKGAYSIIHDDYGSQNMTGIQNYADTIASNRGLRFTFGVITGSTNANEYSRASQMITQHNHEVINHSHSHYCLNKHQDCTWEDQFYWSDADFNLELSQSTNYIKQNTSYTPRFFIYPFDVSSDAANKYLKNLGYIGSRTGTKNLVGLNYNDFSFASSFNDPERFYRTNFIVLDNEIQYSLAHMNKVVTDAITNNAWGNRELHNVGYMGHDNSWGEIATDIYTSHLNFVKEKVDAGDLWMGTVSEVLTYQTQKNAYTPTANYVSQNNQIDVTWNTPSFSVADYLSPLQVKSPITLSVDVSKITNPQNIVVIQGQNTITDFWVNNNQLYANVYPHEGAILIKTVTEACKSICILKDLENIQIKETEDLILSINAESKQNISYQWYKGTTKINGATSNSLTIPYVSSDNQGAYYVVLTNSLGTTQSKTIQVTVQDDGQTPFDGYIAIPGRLEIENFDKGGEGISFHETTLTNDGKSTYRTEGVDVEDITDASTKSVGYIVSGEWLEYSIDIVSQGKYSLTFRTASETTDGSLKVFLDGKEVKEIISLPKTNAWDVWAGTKISNVSLLQGKHVLRIEFTQKDFNLNYIDFVLDEVTNVEKAINQSVTQVYPNPFSDELTVRFVTTPKAVRVIDLLGNVIENHQLEGNENELTFATEVKSGMYIVQLEYADHTEIVRVVKQ